VGQRIIFCFDLFSIFVHCHLADIIFYEIFHNYSTKRGFLWIMNRMFSWVLVFVRLVNFSVFCTSMWTFIRSGLWSLLTWVVDRTGANKFYRDQLVCTEQEPWLFRGGLLAEIQVPACRSLVCVFWFSCYLVWTIFVRETGNMGVRSEWLPVPVFVLVECKVDSKPLKPLTTVFCQLFHLVICCLCTKQL